MKMEDIFKLPVSASIMDTEHANEITKSGESHYCIEDDAYWMASNFDHIKAAAHAINCHDDLVAAVESAIEILANCKADIGYNTKQRQVAELLNEAIIKARGGI